MTIGSPANINLRDMDGFDRQDINTYYHYFV